MSRRPDRYLDRTTWWASRGYRPDGEVHDVLAGSGAVARAAELYELPPSLQCAVCGAPIEQLGTGCPRRTCSDVYRRRRRESESPAGDRACHAPLA